LIAQEDEMNSLGDSADVASRQIWREYPHAIEIQTRCARYKGGHSTWAYGPIYASVEDAIAAGHTHQVECESCGARCGSLAALAQRLP
jgi:hypothetical protein